MPTVRNDSLIFVSGWDRNYAADVSALLYGNFFDGSKARCSLDKGKKPLTG